MPVNKVSSGYRWGQSGKIYPTKSQAQRQGRAAYASGYDNGGIVQLDANGQQYSPSTAKDGILERAKNLLIEQMKRGGERTAQMAEAQTKLPTPSAGQVANFTGMLAPFAGIADAAGEYPALPSGEQPFSEAFSGEPYPSMDENIARGGFGGYFDASMQGLGAFGDTLYAVPFAGPFLGATVGTGAKGIAALGKLAKAATKADKASEGIIALDEAKQLSRLHVDQFAKDDLGFISPTIQALIEKAPVNLKGQQIFEWAKGNTNVGVRPQELEILGLEEFVTNNPNATTREAVEGISGNKIRVSKAIYSGDNADLEFDVTIPETDPLDGSSLWQHRVDDLHSELEQGDEFIKKDVLDHYNFFYNLQLSSFDDIPESVIDDLVEDLAKTQYMQDPYEMVTPYGEQFSSETFAFGNEEVGYNLFVDGNRVNNNDNIAYSQTEAQIQLQEALPVGGGGGGTRFKSDIDNSLPGGENYREVVFNWDNAPVEHNIGHFDNDPTQIAHALTRDRVLADGTPSLHIDELQSDLHTKGSQEGYRTPPKQRKEVFSKLRGFLKDHENYTVHYQKGEEGILYVAQGDGISEFISFEDIGRIADYTNGKRGLFIITRRQTSDALVKNMGEGLDELAAIIKPIIDEGPVPNYPFKDDYHVMVLKNMLLDAIEEGKPALSVSGSAPMKARYSEKYHKFYEMFYDKKIPSAMKKLVNKYGGEFEKGSLDLEDTYGNPQNFYKEIEDEYPDQYDFSEFLKAEIDKAEANIIRITPEMKAKILKDGLQSFSGGGIVDSGIAHLNTPKKKINGRSGLKGLVREIAKQLAKQGHYRNQTTKAQLAAFDKLRPSAAQTSYLAAQFIPGAGFKDASGSMASFPASQTKLKDAFTGDPMPSLLKNLGTGNYFDAGLQGLGVLGDSMYAVPIAGGVLGPTAGSLLKGAGAAGKLTKRGIASLTRNKKARTPLEDYVASQQPSKKLKNKPKEHPVRQLRSQIAEKRDDRASGVFSKPRAGRDIDQRLAYFKEEKRAKNRANKRIDNIINNPNSQYWYKPDKEQILKNVGGAVKRANLKGLVRKMKKEGWLVKHVSKNEGKVASYYVKKGNNTLRVSDHDLPMTAQREHNRSMGLSGLWDGEIVVDSKTNIGQEYKSILDALELR